MRAALLVFLATVLLVFGAAAAAAMLAVHYPDQVHEVAPQSVQVQIPKGASLSQVARRLHHANVIGSTWAFRLYGSWRGLAQRVRAGSYDLRTDMTPRQVLAKLIQGAAEPEGVVTIPEGKTMHEVAQILSEAGVGQLDELVRLVRSHSFAQELGISAPTLEGVLFPNTYRLRPAAPEAALRTLVGQFRQVFRELTQKHASAVESLHRELGFGEREIITLASIVEKETGQAGERPMVASVYLNRLRFPTFQPKLLEADPTIVYGCTAVENPSAACRRFQDRIRTAQLRDGDNPYNTYVHTGLPPGPIANPGRAALEAVLAPADTPYLYFVARNDGTHEFSATLQQHSRAVTRYQR